MVQILLRMSDSPGQWGLVELQGVLETRDQVPFADMHIGDLHFDARGVPNLILGHHLLAGKVVELEKPFAVLKKRVNSVGGTSDCQNPIASAGLDPDPNSSMEWSPSDFQNGTGTARTVTEYEIVALITQKLIFKNRPKPIITKVLPRKIQ